MSQHHLHDNGKRPTPEQLFDEVRLNAIDGIGPLLTQRLLDRFETPAAVLAASKDELVHVNGIGSQLANAIMEGRNSQKAERILELCRQNGIEIISRSDGRYPPSLLEIPDPPVLLYIQGHFEEVDEIALAVVGTRGASWYGKKMSRLLSTELVQAGFTVISGLARGIDAAAHLAAIEANGRTIAVLGSGLLRIFPAEHKGLSQRVIEHGALVSEFHPEAEPLPGNFPRRNRIISGLSLGVLVVESPRKGGSIVTARLATEQNKEVFAVPGPVDQENSRGCHSLIKDGAKLVENIDDIIETLSPLVRPMKHPAKAAPVTEPRQLILNELEDKVLSLITRTPVSVDFIIEQSGLAASQVIGIISALEMRRFVRRGESNTVFRI